MPLRPMSVPTRRESPCSGSYCAGERAHVIGHVILSSRHIVRSSVLPFLAGADLPFSASRTAQVQYSTSRFVKAGRPSKRRALGPPFSPKPDRALSSCASPRTRSLMPRPFGLEGITWTRMAAYGGLGCFPTCPQAVVPPDSIASRPLTQRSTQRISSPESG
jgi:hypothetical protein